MEHPTDMALGEKNRGKKRGDKIRCSGPNSGEYGNDRLLALLEPVHNPVKDVGAVEKRLTVGVFGGIQQAFLDAV